ncbi:MAG: ABC transporter substrate-binding protein [Acidimicrobiales bacterium]
MIGTMRNYGSSRARSASGFTLIELLVVITILGVVSGIVVFSVRGTGDKGKAVARLTDARIMRTAEESYLAKFGSYGTEDELVRERFLSEASTLHDVLLPPAALNGRYEIVCGAGTECSPPAAPLRGGTLVAAISGPTTGSLNPAMSSDGGIHANSEDMFNGLVRWSSTNTVEPELADSWTVSPDGKTVTFELHPGVKWHDGVDFTAADVEYTFEEVLLRYHSRTAASLGPAFGVNVSGGTVNVPSTAVEVVNPTRVVFNLVHAYPNLFRQLNVTEAPIIPKHVYEPCGDAVAGVLGCPANSNPVGTGPFKLDPANPVTATEIHTVRNPAYFKPAPDGQPLPYLDGIVKRVVAVSDNSDEGRVSADVAALQAGTVDWVSGIAGDDLSAVTADTTLRNFAAPRGPGGANCMTMLAFNLTERGNLLGHSDLPAPPHPVLGKLGVRQAIAKAFDRPQTFLEVDDSQGRVADAPISSAIAFAHASGLELPPFDPTAADQLLTTAGYPRDELGDRPDVALDLHYLDNSYLDGYADAMVDAMTELGVDISPVPEDSADYANNVFATRQFDLALVSYCNGEDPQAGVRRQYHSNAITPAAFSNASGYANPTMDQWWDEAAQAPTEAAATEAYRKIQEKAVADLPYVWFVETLNTRAHRGACTGFNYFNTGLFAEAAYCRPRAG